MRTVNLVVRLNLYGRNLIRVTGILHWRDGELRVMHAKTRKR